MALLKDLRTILAAALMACTVAILFSSCSETEDTDNEFADWKNRNEAYFANAMRIAGDSIAEARALYGSDWEQHCNYRQYLCYSRHNGSAHTQTDSIAVEILKRGTGTVSPFTTDSVRIAYRTLLIPTSGHPIGLVADHTGVSTSFDKVFDRNTMSPVNFRVGSLVRGVTTALLYMKSGDRWRVTIPTDLAYGEQSGTSIPKNSTIIFEMELVGVYRNGTTPGTWQ